MDLLPFSGAHSIDDVENILHIELCAHFPPVLERYVDVDDLIEIDHVINLWMLFGLLTFPW